MSEFQYPTIEHIRKVTPLVDEKTIQGFIETLIWLDHGAPHQFDGLPGKYKFDIQEIISRQHDEDADYGEPCGTVCCIGGAVNMYRADGDYWKGASYGLSSLENMDNNLYHLFYPIGGKKPVTAARAVRHYLFTGEVSWNVKPGKTYDV